MTKRFLSLSRNADCLPSIGELMKTKELLLAEGIAEVECRGSRRRFYDYVAAALKVV